ncbi:uncharacterized protein AB675_8859 [Cyphellophora attinorum]|uniref:Uncharacterized protein n=1 Tax=Cyphellophora attinorum TaxID=1664694 RepID=A0A0N0NIV1_9EURO|nr:uncharacterized protein AB675_8859 [Phialophora attinorum]KPI36168.1 hypothetical protein AB675_8859 [Phialophora attinorum]
MATATSNDYAIETNAGIVTTWVPLSTTYSPTQACRTSFRGVYDGGSNDGLNAFDPNYSTLDSSYSCMPAAASVWWDQPVASDQTATTTLGIGPIVCPESWHVVQTSTKDVTSIFSMCCPTGYELSNGGNAGAVVNIQGVAPQGRACVSDVSSGQVINLWSETEHFDSTFSASTTVFAVGLIGMNIDRARLTSSTASSTITSQTATSRTSSNPAASSSGSSNPSGLSTGAKADIGVGAAVVGLALVGLLILFVMRKSRKSKRAHAERRGQEILQADSRPLAELDHSRHEEARPLEKYRDSPAELDAR